MLSGDACAKTINRRPVPLHALGFRPIKSVHAMPLDCRSSILELGAPSFPSLPPRRQVFERQHHHVRKSLSEARSCTIDRRTSLAYQRAQKRARSVLFKPRTTPPAFRRSTKFFFPSWSSSVISEPPVVTSDRRSSPTDPRAQERPDSVHLASTVSRKIDRQTDRRTVRPPLLLQQLPYYHLGLFNLG